MSAEASIYMTRCVKAAEEMRDRLARDATIANGVHKAASANLKKFASIVRYSMARLAKGEILPGVAHAMQHIRDGATDPLPKICTSFDAAAAWRFPTATATASPEPAPRQTTTAAPSPSPATSIFSRYNDPSTARTPIASTASATPAPEDPIAKFEKRVAEYPLLSRQAAREAAARKYPDECRAAQDAARRKMGIR